MPLQPHIRAPSGPKAKGDIKVAIPTAMAPKETPNCCVDLNKDHCEYLSSWDMPCYWEKRKWYALTGFCRGVCTEYQGCNCPAEGEGHFDFNEAMEEKVTFDSSEDTVSEFE